MFRLPVAELGLVDGVGRQVVLRRLVLPPQDVPPLALLLQLLSHGKDLHVHAERHAPVRGVDLLAARRARCTRLLNIHSSVLDDKHKTFLLHTYKANITKPAHQIGAVVFFYY